MLFRLLGKTVWFVGKMTVKHVLVPIAITAATAVVLGKLADRLDAASADSGPAASANGAAPASASRAPAGASAASKPRARKPAAGPADA